MSADAPPSNAVLDAILGRRSVTALVEPAPDDAQVDLLLRAAVTVPDHGTLRPWRFVVVSGPARERFGDALVSAALARQPELPTAAVEKMRSKAFAAPMQVVLVASPKVDNKVPVWEQHASAACTGFAIVLAAHALGLGAVWKSAPFRRGADLDAALELTDDEEILGWVNVGTALDAPSPPEAGAGGRNLRGERPDPAPADVARRLTPLGLAPL